MHVLLISYTSNLKSSDKATILIVYMVKSESLVVKKKSLLHGWSIRTNLDMQLFT